MDSCGSPRGDSSDQAFVIHHIQIGVRRALGSLSPTTLSHPLKSRKGTASPKCYRVIAISIHVSVII
jgi:hypothetical protein